MNNHKLRAERPAKTPPCGRPDRRRRGSRRRRDIPIYPTARERVTSKICHRYAAWTTTGSPWAAPATQSCPMGRTNRPKRTRIPDNRPVVSRVIHRIALEAKERSRPPQAAPCVIGRGPGTGPSPDRIESRLTGSRQRTRSGTRGSRRWSTRHRHRSRRQDHHSRTSSGTRGSRRWSDRHRHRGPHGRCHRSGSP